MLISVLPCATLQLQVLQLLALQVAAPLLLVAHLHLLLQAVLLAQQTGSAARLMAQ